MCREEPGRPRAERAEGAPRRRCPRRQRYSPSRTQLRPLRLWSPQSLRQSPRSRSRFQPQLPQCGRQLTARARSVPAKQAQAAGVLLRECRTAGDGGRHACRQASQ